ncbi:hypothetical protein L211DRAFT_847379 [Terfezia boudieri ATCC MYA-4762]|uniref:Uncharacterized protein n=1 Tax=Terfezia boudieri ATCC MYA-4762 TaxID=1051890 RepID=A0A3N4LYL0_9PEZI|nr:hypothetical protein L211DRAFT_847379 [Terfezia boudieri ATCC MYA-4762]
MDPNARADGSRHQSSSGLSFSHRQSSSHSGSHSGSSHKSREERPLGSENSYDSSGRLTNMSHATSAASDRHKHSTGPPGSGQDQYEWIKAQQGMSREDYSPIESLRSGYGSSSLSHHSSGEDSRSGSHSRSGSVTAPNSPPSGPSPSGSYHSGSSRSGSNKSTPGSHGNGPHHNSRSHRDSSGSSHSEFYHSDSHKSSRHNSSHHDGTSSPLTHEPSGSCSRGPHDLCERDQRDKSRRIKCPQAIGNNPNQGPVSPFINRLSHKICYSMGKPRPTEEEKHHKK